MSKSNTSNKKKFYVVATPIGNLEDMTFRAMRILGEVDIVVCEDTRVTGKLLNHYNIKTKTMSYHANSTDNKENEIIKLVNNGTVMALVSDAGTPCISDPGVRLIRRLYELCDDIEIIPIPGASALVSALSVSGISSAEFMFMGFVPHKKGRETFFKKISKSEMPAVFYESTHRFMKSLESLEKEIDVNRLVIVAREMTKIHEEIIRGNIAHIKKYFEENKDHQRGEYVFIVN